MRLIVDGKPIVVKAGESLRIPPNVPHSAEVLEDCVAVDVFSPVRQDWVRGDDCLSPRLTAAYLQRLS